MTTVHNCSSKQEAFDRASALMNDLSADYGEVATMFECFDGYNVGFVDPADGCLYVDVFTY